MAVHTAAATSLTRTDLRAELEHRHVGEDDHITIEHRRERRHNLKDDYGTTNAAPAGHAVHSPSSLRTGGGCVALAPLLRMVVWPPKFWPHLPEKYDGTINPTEFMQIYTTSVSFTLSAVVGLFSVLVVIASRSSARNS
jgi:hypothetical protein